MRPISAPARRQSGFTIVELMVGVLIGLVATVVMFQVFAVSEGQKRTTTYAGDAQQNGVASLFQVERDARMAGYGINYSPLLGCQINGWYEPSGATFTLTLAPVVITNGAAGAPDQISFMYGSSDLFMAPAKLTQSMPSPSSVYKVDNRYGFNEGDLVIAAEAGKPCTLAQVSTLPGNAGNTDNVIHNSGNYTDDSGRQLPTQYNKPSGLGTSYAAWNPASGAGGVLYNLGSLPTVVTYAVQSDQLVVIDGLQGAGTQIISDGVVQIQAQYGYDGDADGRVPQGATINSTLVLNGPDQWSDTMPVGTVASTEWQKVIAVRLAVVSRSGTPEKPDPATGICNTTTVGPTWQATGRVIDLSANASWKCYRYRLFEVVVPLRNMVWFALPA
jgi:type IV pilus assembly protein PilW